MDVTAVTALRCGFCVNWDAEVAAPVRCLNKGTATAVTAVMAPRTRRARFWQQVAGCGENLQGR